MTGTARRVYLPLTSTGLAAFVADRRLRGPVRGHAVTAGLVAAWPDGDDERWEYAALMAAAAESAAARRPGDLPRRYALAVDVPADDAVDPAEPTAVTVPGEVRWEDVAAVLADAGDGAADDDELGWYAASEAADLG